MRHNRDREVASQVIGSVGPGTIDANHAAIRYIYVYIDFQLDVVRHTNALAGLRYQILRSRDLQTVLAISHCAPQLEQVVI